MKRFTAAVSILILLAILSGCSPTISQLSNIPHENPTTVRSSPGWPSLFLFYSNIFEKISLKKHDASRSILNELENASIPDKLRYLVDRFNVLSEELMVTLNNLELFLNTTTSLLADNRISDAQEKLTETEATINDARFLLEDIDVATNMLGNKAGVFAALAGSEIRRSYERFEEMLSRVKTLIDDYNQLRENLVEKQKTQAVELMTTTISLDTSSTRAFVGDNITVSGRLTKGRKPLPNRQLTVWIDNEPLVTSTTINGSYVTEITIPYKYISTMKLYAEYIPDDDDISTYLASRSRQTIINTRFYPTLLTISAPESVHPGISITVSGEVSSTDGSTDRSVRISLDNNKLVDKTIVGKFDAPIILPAELPDGEHTITVDVAPKKRYAGASQRLPINVSLIPIEMEIQSPLLTITPKTIQISGKVYYGVIPIKDAGVTIIFKETRIITRTSSDGSFTIHMEAPFDLSLIGPQEFTTTIKPAEPWYAQLEIKRGIFTINLANMGVILVAFVSLGLLGLSRVRARPPSQPEEMVIRPTQPKELPGVTALEPGYKVTGIKGRVLSAYSNGLKVVERATSIPMMPDTTLMEFVNATSTRLANARQPFNELTIITQTTLYSAHKLDKNTAARAERLADIIKEELNGGTT